MTVAIGLVCRNGVLVASDSMGSNNQVASPSIKVHTFAENPVVWTAAGSVYVMEEVEAVLTAKLDDKPLEIFTSPDELKVRERLKSFITPAMRACYKSALGESAMVQPGQVFIQFPTDFLLLGWAGGKPWFLEFSHDGQVNSHTSRRFYAVGSGGPFASVCHGLMSHYLTSDIDLEDGKLLAYRAIATTCQVSSGGVGLPVQIAVADDNGQKLLDSEEIIRIGIEVDRWKALESETLRMTHESAETTAVKDLPTLQAE